MERKSFERYIDDIVATDKLSADEERELSQRIMKGDQRAVDKLATANLKFVVAMARKYQGKGVDIDDLVAEGNIALLKAAGKFDAAKSGSRFTSYAAPFISKAFEEAIGKYDETVPKASDANAVATHKMSVDAPLNGRDNVSMLNILPNEDSPYADTLITQNALSDEMESGLLMLDEREQNVVRMYFGIGCEKLTMAEIGQQLSLKRERVRQIRDKALRKMRKNK